MSFISRVFIVAIVVLAVPRSLAAGSPDGATLIDGAAKRLDLRREGSAPIQLRARVVVTDAKGEKLEGNYRLLWVSPTAWLEEIAFPTFWEIAGRSSTRSWRKRKLDISPEPVHWLRQTVSFADRLKRKPTRTEVPVERRRVRGIEQACVKVYGSAGSWSRWCFDSSSGDLLREEADDGPVLDLVIVYSDWREAEGKRFPGKISYSAAKRKRIELTVTEFEKVHETDPAWFEPPQGAEDNPVCDLLEPPKSSAKFDIPRSPDGRYLKGEAAVEFRVAVDGSVRRIRISSATSPEIGHALAELAAKMRFIPAMCDGTPVEMDYTLRQAVR